MRKAHVAFVRVCIELRQAPRIEHRTSCHAGALSDDSGQRVISLLERFRLTRYARRT